MAPSPKKKKDKANVKPRNWLTISQKLEIIRMKEVGSSFAKIASEKNIAGSSVRAIFSRKDEIKAQGKENYLYQKIESILLFSIKLPLSELFYVSFFFVK